MSDLKRYEVGESIVDWPTKTWNALVAAEELRRAMGPPSVPGAESEFAPLGACRVIIKNNTSETVPTGGSLKLDGSLRDPADRAGVVYEGIVLKGIEPTVGMSIERLAIAMRPIPAGKLGPAVIPNAAWARVNVDDEAHEYATPAASVAALTSSAGSGLPIIWKQEGTGPKWAIVLFSIGSEVTVYEFQLCSDPLTKLYVDNAEVESHLPGGENDDKRVAMILRNGEYDCWRLNGVANGEGLRPACKTGECVAINLWLKDCTQCEAPCVRLYECGNPTNNFIVRGFKWLAAVDKVAQVDIEGTLTCFDVVEVPTCDDAVDSPSEDDLKGIYDDCTLCDGCYELTNCYDDEDVRYIKNDLTRLLGVDTPTEIVEADPPFVLSYAGTCYEVTDHQSPCTEEEVEYLCDGGLGFGCGEGAPQLRKVDDCAQCCYVLTPCEGQSGEGAETPLYRTLQASDYDLSELVNEDGSSNGKVIRLANMICYTVARASDCTEAVHGLGTVLDVYDSCELCVFSCLLECGTESTYIRTYSDLSTGGIAPMIDTVFKRVEDEKCYRLKQQFVDPDDFTGGCTTGEFVEFTIEEEYGSTSEACDHCTDPKYKLTPEDCGCSPCEGDEGDTPSDAEPLVSDQAGLEEAVGQYVKIDGKCYKVERTTDAVTDEDLCWTGPFDTCAACGAGESKMKVVTVDKDGNFKLSTLLGYFSVCSDDDVEEPCPAPE